MKVVSKILSTSCCGSKSLTLVFDSTYSTSLASFLINRNFFILDGLLKTGSLYAKSNGIILTGLFGSSKIQIRCQGSGCDFQIQNIISELEKYEAGNIPSKAKSKNF